MPINSRNEGGPTCPEWYKEEEEEEARQWWHEPDRVGPPKPLSRQPSLWKKRGAGRVFWGDKWHNPGYIFYLFIFLFRATVGHMEVTRMGVKSELQLRPTPQSQQCRIQAVSTTYTAACGNAGFLTHWLRPGIKPTSSRILLGFVARWATMGTPKLYLERITLASVSRTDGGGGVKVKAGRPDRNLLLSC